MLSLKVWSQEEQNAVFDEGRNARLSGKGLHDNPYKEDETLYACWDRGWVRTDSALRQGE